MSTYHDAAVVLDVVQQLQDAKISLIYFLRLLLSNPRLQMTSFVQELKSSLPNILDLFVTENSTKTSSQAWVLDYVTTIYSREIQMLTRVDEGHHFTAERMTMTKFEDCNINYLAERLQSKAPNIWKLLENLLQADPNIIQRRKAARKRRAMMALQARNNDSDTEQGMDVQEKFPTDEDMSGLVDREILTDADEAPLFDKADVPDNIEEIFDKREKKITCIKQIVCMSVMMQNTNQKCNALQALVGLFLQACGAPEAVVELLSHFGLSISTTAVNNAVRSLSVDSEKQIRTAASTFTASFAYDNLDINLKHHTPTLENTHESSIVHLTSASIFPLNHGVTPSDLDCSDCVHKIFVNPEPISMEQLELHFANQELLNEKFSWETYTEYKIIADLLQYGPSYFQQFKDTLIPPNDVECIPVVKSIQIPMRAVPIGPSRPAENAQVLEELFKQANIGDTNNIPGPPTNLASNDATMDQSAVKDIGNQVILVFGDLLTLQHIRSLMLQRAEERTPFRRFQFVVSVLGLFHFKMACVDVIWKEFIAPTNAKKGHNTLLSFVSQIRKNDVKKLKSKPDFRSMHEVVQHVGIVARLDIWRVTVNTYTKGLASSLEEWAALKPTWEEILTIAQLISTEHIAMADMDQLRNQKSSCRDQVKENMMLIQRQFLLYEETTYAMNHGDIGRLEATFLPWIHIFTGCGKHKYAAELKRYLENVHFRYPKPLSHAIRMNILCNPTGRPDAFRGIDWVIEFNNLYIKRIHGGQFSNRTIDRMIIESPLIETYKNIRRQFEDMFCLDHRTVYHSPANMTGTFAKLGEYMRKEETNNFIPGRKAEYEIRDAMAIGIQKSRDREGNLGIEEESESPEAVEIEVQDDGSLDL